MEIEELSITCIVLLIIEVTYLDLDRHYDEKYQ